jgi:hypothetical protein
MDDGGTVPAAFCVGIIPENISALRTNAIVHVKLPNFPNLISKSRLQVSFIFLPPVDNIVQAVGCKGIASIYFPLFRPMYTFYYKLNIQMIDIFIEKSIYYASLKLLFLPIVLFESTSFPIPKYTCTLLHPSGRGISQSGCAPVHLYFPEVQRDFSEVQSYFGACIAVFLRIPRTLKEYNCTSEKYG